MKRNSPNKLNIVKTLLLPLFAAAVILLFFTAMSNFKQGESDEGQLRLEKSLREACTSCYASEGYYPPTLEYIAENYGISAGSDYTVFYEIFSDNLMPDITVLKK